MREVCGAIPDHDWNIIVGHALSCNPGHGFYSYCIPERDATIIFNSLYNIVGAKFNGTNISFEELNDTQKDLVEACRAIAYDNLKEHNEHELIFGDKGSCYLRGSCSMPPCPTLPTKFHDEPSHEDEALENDPPRESPRPRQRWVKIVTKIGILTTFTTVHLWKNQLRAAVSPRVMSPPNDPVDSPIRSPSWNDLLDAGLLDSVSLERLLAEDGFSGVLSG